MCGGLFLLDALLNSNPIPLLHLWVTIEFDVQEITVDVRNLLEGLHCFLDNDLCFLLSGCTTCFETLGECTLLRVEGFTLTVQRCTFASNLFTLALRLATDVLSVTFGFLVCLVADLFCVSLRFLACCATDTFSLLLCALELGLCSAAGLRGTVYQLFRLSLGQAQLLLSILVCFAADLFGVLLSLLACLAEYTLGNCTRLLLGVLLYALRRFTGCLGLF